jgi:hypothetical protein
MLNPLSSLVFISISRPWSDLRFLDQETRGVLAVFKIKHMQVVYNTSDVFSGARIQANLGYYVASELRFVIWTELAERWDTGVESAWGARGFWRLWDYLTLIHDRIRRIPFITDYEESYLNWISTATAIFDPFHVQSRTLVFNYCSALITFKSFSDARIKKTEKTKEERKAANRSVVTEQDRQYSAAGFRPFYPQLSSIPCASLQNYINTRL